MSSFEKYKPIYLQNWGKVWLISVGNPSAKVQRYDRKSMLSSTWNMRCGAFSFSSSSSFSIFSIFYFRISSSMHSSHGDLDWRAETTPEGRNVVDGDERKSMLLPESGSPFLPRFVHSLAMLFSSHFIPLSHSCSLDLTEKRRRSLVWGIVIAIAGKCWSLSLAQSLVK